MLRILLIAATPAELEGTAFREGEETSLPGNVSVKVLITGVGIPLALFHTTRALSSENYQLVLQAGIAGSFHSQIPVGSLVHVIQDYFGDTGIVRDPTFLLCTELGLSKEQEYDYQEGGIPIDAGPYSHLVADLMKVKAVTINAMNSGLLEKSPYFRKYAPDIETMEGACVALVCKKFSIPLIQLRAISNMVWEADSRKWPIETTVQIVGKKCTDIISELGKSKLQTG